MFARKLLDPHVPLQMHPSLDRAINAEVDHEYPFPFDSRRRPVERRVLSSKWSMRLDSEKEWRMKLFPDVQLVRGNLPPAVPQFAKPDGVGPDNDWGETICVPGNWERQGLLEPV